jgi:hypothetical protein
VRPQLDTLGEDLTVRENLITDARYCGIPGGRHGGGRTRCWRRTRCWSSCSSPTVRVAKSHVWAGGMNGTLQQPFGVLRHRGSREIRVSSRR